MLMAYSVAVLSWLAPSLTLPLQWPWKENKPMWLQPEKKKSFGKTNYAKLVFEVERLFPWLVIFPLLVL